MIMMMITSYPGTVQGRVRQHRLHRYLLYTKLRNPASHSAACSAYGNKHSGPLAGFLEP